MTLKINEKDIYKTSAGTVIKNLGSGRFALWNRYAPSALQLNGDAVKLLEFMKTNTRPYKVFRGFKRSLRKMIAANLLYKEKEDTFRKNFFQSGDRFMDNFSQRLKQRVEEKKPYSCLSLYNQSCNLNCSYCVMAYVKGNKSKQTAPKPPRQEKKKCLEAVIDRAVKGYGQDYGPGSERQLQVMFNGGEFLLEWELMKHAVEYLETRYPHVKTELNVNTNATLVTDEIASFWNEKNFKTIGVSIDGYEETHDKSRVYHDGTGSYRDVIKGIDTINRHIGKPLDFFQGTLVPEHRLDVERLMEMKALNFKRARLGVNLLGISNREAREMAGVHFDMAVRSIEEGWSAMDDYFKSYSAILGSSGGGKNRFSFFCRGFTDLAGETLYYNVETRQVNLLCSFVTGCHVNLSDINNDIYHPALFENAEKYLRKRYETIKTVCADCEVVAACRGGCILNGIDSYNKPNEAACVFVKETWTRYIDYAFKKRGS